MTAPRNSTVQLVASNRRRRVRQVLGVAIAIAVFAFALPRIADYGDVGEIIADFDRSWLVPLLVVSILNLLAPAASQVAALPGLTMRRATVTDWATSALTNVVPGGSAMAIGLTTTMYRSWGHTTDAVARSIIITGVWDIIVKLAMPAVALGWLAASEPVTPGLVQATIISLVLLVGAVLVLLVVAGSPTMAARLTRPIRRFVRAEQVEEWRQATLELLHQRWQALTFWTLAGHLNLAVLLGICIRGVGVDSAGLTAAAILAAFAFGRLVTAVPITPGGIGILELGLTAALVASGQDGIEAQVVAAVLLFRFVSFALPIPMGIMSWLWWNNRSASPTAER